MNNTDFLDILKQRYATKAMNGKSIPKETLNRILEAIQLAPTSSGLQPFEIIVVENDEIKAEIRKVGWNQPQITDCSHLLVFAAWDNYTEARINQVFDLTNEIRGFKNEGWENYRQLLLSTYPKRSAQENFQHAARQTYIALMAAITQATTEGVDSTPMEGFENDKVDTILKLDKKYLKSTLLLPLGYRDADNDWLVNLEKVRKPINQLITIIH